MMIPVTAEDVERQSAAADCSSGWRLRCWCMLAGWIVYKRINDPRNAREAFDAGMRLVRRHAL